MTSSFPVRGEMIAKRSLGGKFGDAAPSIPLGGRMERDHHPPIGMTTAIAVGRAPWLQSAGDCQPFSTKLSMTFLSPALSKATDSLLPSTAVTLP